jgi:hypothetical protein
MEVWGMVCNVMGPSISTPFTSPVEGEVTIRTVELIICYPSPYIKLFVSSLKNQLTIGLGVVILRNPEYLKTVRVVISSESRFGLTINIAKELF